MKQDRPAPGMYLEAIYERTSFATEQGWLTIDSGALSVAQTVDTILRLTAH